LLSSDSGKVEKNSAAVSKYNIKLDFQANNEFWLQQKATSI